LPSPAASRFEPPLIDGALPKPKISNSTHRSAVLLAYSDPTDACRVVVSVR
jgi:hypothetical protein